MSNISPPALFRAGDIGVSSEWRDISYDWPPVLTAAGVSIYSYLRDTHDHQRNLRPFILDPDGPSKTLVQQMLGYRTSWAIQGPEYLLATVGLLHVETGYRANLDPERPKHTRVAYYVVGRLDHPVLDWQMLSRVLDALMLALGSLDGITTTTEPQRKAQAALRSLSQAGMFQNVDPEDLFYPYGAWPTLLPTLVWDERWSTLFAHLHGENTVEPYRQQARAWVEYVQRSAARLMRENREIGDQLLAAQRRGPRGPRGASGENDVRMAVSPLPVCDRTSHSAATSDEEAVGVTRTAPVAGLSLACRQAVGVTRTASATVEAGSQPDALKPSSSGNASMSLRQDQLINCSSTGEICLSGRPATGATPSDVDVPDEDELPLIEPHLREAELSSTRQDAMFWCEVHRILYGSSERYDHTPGERQAALRRFKKIGIPVGVVLAALRTVMTLPPAHRPARFSDALKMSVFHACVQQALALLPVRAAGERNGTWLEFLQSYRRIGQSERLRDVSTTDYHVLQALFTRQPDECWEVLSRAEHAAQVPALSPAYLRRAIVNNQRAAAQQVLLRSDQTPPCGRHVAPDGVVQPLSLTPSPVWLDDPRCILLEREGISADVLTDEITEVFLRAWIAEADVRRAEIHMRPNWLRWGITSRYLPKDHPDLQSRSRYAAPHTDDDRSFSVPANGSAPLALDPGLVALWQSALAVLRDELPHDVCETWVSPCRLIALETSEQSVGDERIAILAVPNIFVRQELESAHLGAIQQALQATMTQVVEVRLVIGC